MNYSLNMDSGEDIHVHKSSIIFYLLH